MRKLLLIPALLTIALSGCAIVVRPPARCERLPAVTPPPAQRSYVQPHPVQSPHVQPQPVQPPVQQSPTTAVPQPHVRCAPLPPLQPLPDAPCQREVPQPVFFFGIFW